MVNQQWFNAEELHKAGVTDDEIQKTPGFRPYKTNGLVVGGGIVARIPDPKRPDLMMPDDWPRFANAVMNRVCRACGNSAGSAFTVHQQVVAGWRMMVRSGRHSQDICPACIECGRLPRGWDLLDAGEKKKVGDWSQMLSPAITPGPHKPAEPLTEKVMGEVMPVVFDDPFQVNRVIDNWGLGWNLGNVVSFIYSRFDKGDDIENLEKAMFYLKREIDASKAGRRVPHG